MDYPANLRHELLESLESCRANSVDLDSGDLNDPVFAELATALGHDPELRVHFERVQRADAAIRTALADVPLPADLSERVMRRLAAPAADSPAPLQDEAPAKSQRFSRRRAIAVLAALSASAAMLTFVWLHNNQTSPLTSDEVLARSMQFFGGEGDTPGQLVSQVAPPAEYPISRDLRRSASIRWRRVGKFLGGEAVAYDLPAITGRATLYVVRRNVAGLPSSPPGIPDLSTAGNSIAAWESNGLVYVLVVQGDERTYAEYFDRGPLT
jgi:hypothetical protein